MAKSVKELYEANLKYSNGEPVKVVIADTTIDAYRGSTLCRQVQSMKVLISL